MDIEELEKKHCVPCEGGVDPLDEDAARQIAKAIDPEWSIAEDFKSISREFKFDGYNKTCLLYTSPSPRDATLSRMPSSA